MIPVTQDEQKQIRREGAHAQVQGTRLAQARHHRVHRPCAPGHYFGHDVNRQEAHGAERDGAVYRLGDDPAARGHDNAVGGEQADADRRGEPDKREDPP